MTDPNKRGRETWLVLEKLKENIFLTPNDDLVRYEIDPRSKIIGYPSALDQASIIGGLHFKKAIKIIRQNILSKPYEALYEEMTSKEGLGTVKGFFFEVLYPRFDEVVDEYSPHDNQPSVASTETDGYTVTIKGQKIWVNDFLLSKPFSNYTPLLFFECVFRNANKQTRPATLPALVRKEVAGKDFIKIIGALGFKGEILEAFFPKRSKNLLFFRKKVSKAELEAEKINIQILELQLQAAHLKNTPK